MEETLEIIMHSSHLGASDQDDILDTLIRMIAWANATESQRESDWVDKYGINYQNDTFLMHPYCWCERDDCLWCSGCACPWGETEYFLDGGQVTDWWEENKKIIAPAPSAVAEYGTPEYEVADAAFYKRIEERDRRLKTFYPARIHTCQPSGLMENRDRTEDWKPRQQAPNFWYKPTDWKVWWYKYIGRGMEVNHIIRSDELHKIANDCIPDIATAYIAVTESSRIEAEQFAAMLREVQ